MPQVIICLYKKAQSAKLKDQNQVQSSKPTSVLRFELIFDFCTLIFALSLFPLTKAIGCGIIKCSLKNDKEKKMRWTKPPAPKAGAVDAQKAMAALARNGKKACFGAAAVEAQSTAKSPGWAKKIRVVMVEAPVARIPVHVG